MEDKEQAVKTKIGRDVAEKILDGIYSDLGISRELIDEDDDMNITKKLVNAIMMGRLEYMDGKFKLQLLSPISTGGKEISCLEITEPTGADLREMASIKNAKDDVGKAMAVLASVTSIGLPVLNKMRSRDMMVAVGVMSLFL